LSKDEREFLDELRTKSIEAAAEIMESLQRLKTLYDEISDDGSGNPLPRPKPGDFFYRLAKFELEHASNVIRLGNSQAELIFDHVRQLAQRNKPGAVPTSVVQLELDASGKSYVGSFEIKNPFDHEADPRFQISPMRDANGNAIEKAKLTASHGGGSLAAHRTAKIHLAVPSSAVAETLFGELAVFLVGEADRQIARRAIKVRPAAAAKKKPK
jgi:hypothetical protein